jgi:hypothetical protein
MLRQCSHCWLRRGEAIALSQCHPARLPGDRRYANRARSLAQRLSIDKSLHDGLLALLEKKA